MIGKTDAGRLFAAVVLLLALGRAEAQTPEPVDLAWQKINAGALLIDVRSPQEYAAGHLSGAVNIPHDQALVMAWFIKEKSREVVMYCGSGRRVGIAQAELESMGFDHIFNGSGYQAMMDGKPVAE